MKMPCREIIEMAMTIPADDMTVSMRDQIHHHTEGCRYCTDFLDSTFWIMAAVLDQEIGRLMEKRCIIMAKDELRRIVEKN
jgi:hypothetical protein